MQNIKIIEDYEIDPLSTEEKIILAHQEPIDLPPWEITEIVENSLINITEELNVEQMDIIFDAVYDAISEALLRVRPQI